MARRQGIFWCLTIPGPKFTPFLPPSVQWLKCQLEQGAGGYVHWQCVCAMERKSSLRQVKAIFGESCHAELSRSDAADAYVWKEDTRIGNHQYEFGAKPFQRNKRVEWESVWESAKRGDLQSIPASVRVVSYRTLRAIGSDHAVPRAMVRTCRCFWGATGTGKSRMAWEEAGEAAYIKNPCTKFWDGYQAQETVIIDEFRGRIDISYLLRWLDRYPVTVEIKGSSRPLCASRFWITSNVEPQYWYPDADPMSVAALLRRLDIVFFPEINNDDS
nr:MAG: replication associated protein [Cressdnaviricota sp.]